MARNYNTTSAGGPFDASIINTVWQKATAVAGQDPNVYRKDPCGAWIQRNAYGTTGKYGWEIDHEKPIAHGGTDILSNLQPLHWENNRHKSDNWPKWFCKRLA